MPPSLPPHEVMRSCSASSSTSSTWHRGASLSHVSSVRSHDSGRAQCSQCSDITTSAHMLLRDTAYVRCHHQRSLERAGGGAAGGWRGAGGQYHRWQYHHCPSCAPSVYPFGTLARGKRVRPRPSPCHSPVLSLLSAPGSPLSPLSPASRLSCASILPPLGVGIGGIVVYVCACGFEGVRPSSRACPCT